MENPLRKLLGFLDRLEECKISYRLEHVRDSIMITVAVPGERWEVEVFDDNHVEIERFVSAGSIAGEEAFDELISIHSDP